MANHINTFCIITLASAMVMEYYLQVYKAVGMLSTAKCLHNFNGYEGTNEY